MTTPLLPPIAGNLLGRFRIRKATPADAAACDRIARQFKSELGFVRRDNLTRSASKGLLHVGEIDGVVRGFVEYNTPTRGANRGYSVVYHLATERGWGGYGIGRNLLYSVPTPIRLKCTVDNSTANTFYAGAGMRLTATEPGKKRALNVWELRVLSILCHGGNPEMPFIARASRMAYGVRHDCIAYGYPFMLDIDWRDYHWGDYLRKVKYLRPVQAMVADYEHPDQKPQMLRQIEDLRQLGVMRIKVCPKFDGAVADIPQDCIIAVSVPSRYAGFIPDHRELVGRKVHLLGGSPHQWLGQSSGRKYSATGLIAALNGIGAQVLSCDGNSHQTAATYGAYWVNGHWERFYRPDKTFVYSDLRNTMIFSGRNIVQELNAVAGVVQLPLFAA